MGKKQGAGAVVLDLLLKSGTMTEKSNHRWKMVPGGEKDRNYMFGDRKLIELFQAFWNGISSRGVSLSQASAQCEEFEKALLSLIALLGDSHTGLNRGQSILKCFYRVLLEPTQNMLGWKRCNEKMSTYYYQMLRIIKLTNKELH